MTIRSTHRAMSLSSTLPEIPAVRGKRRPRNGAKEEVPEEGAGNNDEGAGNTDEREAPEPVHHEDRQNKENRPPTNRTPDGEHDPAKPGFREPPHPKDKFLNTYGYDPERYPYESPDFIDVSRFDILTGRFNWSGAC
jgi:hypothetical protein